jgi:hypothetical protein
MAVHRHRSGFRGVVTVTTPVYKTEAEAVEALAELKTRLNTLKAPAQPASARLDPFRPSCDYPRPRFHFH